MEPSASERLIVGLGNPGPRYALTRHNLGFRVIDAFIAGAIRSRTIGRGGILAEVEYEGVKALCLKPDEFMNRSGDAVLRVAASRRIPPESMLVVYDDLDLALGRIRLRAGGSAGGHRGVADVARAIGPAFDRLRIGIGRPAGELPAEAFVLERFRAEECAEVEKAIARSARACEHWLRHGIRAAMNEYNGEVQRRSEKEEE